MDQPSSKTGLHSSKVQDSVMSRGSSFQVPHGAWEDGVEMDITVDSLITNQKIIKDLPNYIILTSLETLKKSLSCLNKA